MSRHSITVLLVLCLSGMQSVTAQETTERYIPIGESPGVSGRLSIIGTIVRVDHAAYTMVVRGADDSETVTLDEDTEYYIDRSASKRTNQAGEFEDCQVGRRVEAKTDEQGRADWVKIEAPAAR